MLLSALPRKSANKYGVSADTIKRVGNSRKKVYAALEKM